MKRTLLPLAVLTLTSLFSCSKSEDRYDASGTFEAVETIVSAQASGIIKELNLEEGQVLKAGQTIGYIDSIQLYLKKQQLLAQVKATLSSKPDIHAQTAALQEQLYQALREQKRTASLLKSDAATQKQLDDANTQVGVIRKQITALQSSLGITSASLNDQTVPLSVQIQQIDDQLSKSKIVNQVNGTVLTKYAEVNEGTDVGKPIYKIAALNTITLRAYITGNQLIHIKVGQQVKVLVDDTKDSYKTYPGIIEWVSNKAEFTPKTIQTKDERANLVYAIKIRVKNDGYLKIGMYGEVKL
ncbi:Macrolide export protein MacA [Pedobacter sp. Bi27]|uniref:HlyD family secretion protein n=1 Tax=unclassified Pedobacter TaxID=2628915 RepID=UPI001E174F3C|nr:MULTISPECIES: HlyD family efflux transporter periplasmic adaptor subunit [unclassified Pedobacter]CAH0273968.1 Macrolide export protein MacA [Pedobacter sp. Bi36]CAH0297682.1 Macrolide export protein MacA [Pedobacter sp. Bi126]CAH0310043.1 Macrolide export protein MacA [Pedobacter sp. Bi27]